MKKHLLGERIASKVELSKSIIFFILIYFSQKSFSQIPINGFCKLNSYKFSAGHSKLFSFNFNDDSYTDLLLYNPFEKRISLAVGKEGEKFEQERKLEFTFPLSNIMPVREKNNQIKEYAFTSRKNRSAGLCEFAANGKPKITHQLEFNSYPQSISVSNINTETGLEVLISGPAFEGLSLLKKDQKKLKELKIVRGGNYPEAIFVDLSNDKSPDISAFNLLNQSIDFFYNGGRGNFKLTRKIQLEQKLRGLKTFDINFDSYHDLIFSEGKKLKIIYGDFSSSYSKQVEIETYYYPDDYIFGDFNKDGLIDFAYLSIDASLVSVVLAMNESSYYQEIPLFHRTGMAGIIPFYSKFIDGLALICEDGTLLTNTRLAGLGTEINLSLSVNPISLNYFDAGSNDINDICWLDNYDRSLKLLVRNIDGVPSALYKIRMRADHNQLEIKNFSKESTTFFCYAENKKLVEVVTVDFKSGKIVRDEFYASRPISQVKAVLGETKLAAISSNHKNNLSIEFFEHNDGWILFSEQNISQNVPSSYLSSLEGIKIFFWKQDTDSIKLFRKSFLPDEQKAELILKMKMPDVNNFLTIADDFNNLAKESVISFVESNEKHYILVSYDAALNMFEQNEFNKMLIINSRDQLFAGEVRRNGIRRLAAFNPVDNSIYRLNIAKKGKKIGWSKLISEIEAERFFIKNLTVNDYHLVYINSNKRTISIKQI